MVLVRGELLLASYVIIIRVCVFDDELHMI